MHSAHLRSQGIEHRRAITPVREHPRLILASMGLVDDAPLRSLDRSLMLLVLESEFRRACLGVGRTRLLAHRFHSGLGDAHATFERPSRLGRLLEHRSGHAPERSLRGHSEGTQRSLRGHSEGTQKALGRDLHREWAAERHTERPVGQTMANNGTLHRTPAHLERRTELDLRAAHLRLDRFNL